MFASLDLTPEDNLPARRGRRISSGALQILMKYSRLLFWLAPLLTAASVLFAQWAYAVRFANELPFDYFDSPEGKTLRFFVSDLPFYFVSFVLFAVCLAETRRRFRAKQLSASLAFCVYSGTIWFVYALCATVVFFNANGVSI